MARAGIGCGPESWGLSRTSVQALEPEGLEHGKAQAHSARFSRVKLRLGQEAMPDGLCCCLDWDWKAELSTGLRHRASPFGVEMQNDYLFPMGNKGPGGSAEC